MLYDTIFYHFVNIYAFVMLLCVLETILVERLDK